ncbi:MAG TPA: hypothetical protein VHT05_05115 [Candidatus Elarobacter sp.]|nr:hypothetical protein [Candidatus Elarobacter sp.]
MLRAGTAVVFVTDGSLEPGRREGDVVSVHLRDPLVLDGATLAPAGARAELFVGGTMGADGKRHPVYTLQHFMINAGLMPVRSVAPIVPPVPMGTAIQATTQAEVDHLGDRYSIRLPFPFRLSGEAPASAYTPTPARTAPPFTFGRRRGSPTPVPTAQPTAQPPPTPLPAETKIPSS